MSVPYDSDGATDASQSPGHHEITKFISSEMHLASCLPFGGKVFDNGVSLLVKHTEFLRVPRFESWCRRTVGMGQWLLRSAAISELHRCFLFLFSSIIDFSLLRLRSESFGSLVFFFCTVSVIYVPLQQGSTLLYLASYCRGQIIYSGQLTTQDAPD